MAASVLPVWVAPLGSGSNNGLVVTDGLAVATTNGMPICQDHDERLHLTRRANDERNLSYVSELVVQPARQRWRNRRCGNKSNRTGAR